MGDIRGDLERVCNELRTSIEQAKALHVRNGQDPFRALDTSGRPILADMLSAEALALAALSQLED